MNRTQRIHFDTGDQRTSGIVTFPLAERIDRGVLLLHPHPLYGGSMDDFVTSSIERELLRLGLAAMRFNFRPVEPGTTYAGLSGAISDALAAWEVFRDAAMTQDIGFIGYSFGGSVALHLAALHSPSFLITLSASYRLASEVDSIDERLEAITCPVLLVHGSGDRVVPISEQEKIAKLIGSENVRTLTVKGEGHFYNRYLRTVLDEVIDFVNSLGQQSKC